MVLEEPVVQEAVETHNIVMVIMEAAQAVLMAKMEATEVAVCM